jgi:WD40 repeat protein
LELTCFAGHVGWVDSVACSPNGRHILSGSNDQTVRVWDAASGECLEVIQGSGDAASIAAAGKTSPWRAINRNLETVIEPAGDGDAVA